MSSLIGGGVIYICKLLVEKDFGAESDILVEPDFPELYKLYGLEFCFFWRHIILWPEVWVVVGYLCCFMGFSPAIEV